MPSVLSAREVSTPCRLARPPMYLGCLGPDMLPSLLFVGLLATPLGKLLLALILVAVVLVIGRVLMGVAWRLVTIAIVVVGGLWILSVGL